MLTFEPYHSSLLPEVISIFRSNVPKYFFDYEEKDLVKDLPDFEDTYFLMRFHQQFIGCGGYALNADNTVSLCWGMVRQDAHGKNFGKALLDFRLREIQKNHPGKNIVQSTSQHTAGFFEKYNFVSTRIIKDGFGPGLDEYKMILKP